MFAKIVGWFWIIVGVLFLLKPAMLKNKLQKKSFKKIKKYLFLLAVILGGILVSIGFKYSGFFPKLVMVLGIISIVKGFYFLKGKAAEKVLGWFLNKPLIFFRFSALFYIVLGALILYLAK
ncbi:MAG TPA: hypothetical protein ENH41_03815 [Candidatus Omnitrophica bacterium]|nr:hypothetical protein [Candidatus Omnitrophota bacterium]